MMIEDALNLQQMERHLQSTSGANRLQVSEDGSSAHCELVGLNPFNSTSYKILSYESALGIELAIRHLNEGNGTLVSELKDLPKSCPITFSATHADTQQDASLAFSLVDDMTTKPCDSNNNSSLPCAFIGAVDSGVSKNTALVTSLREFPQISHASSSTSLNEFELFGRSIPDNSFMSETFIQFMHKTLRARHFYVIFEPHPATESALENLRDAIRRLGYAPKSGDNETAKEDYMYMEESRILLGSTESMKEALKKVKESDFRFVLTLTRLRSMNDELIELAYDEGMAGPNTDYHWSFFFAQATLGDRKFSKDCVTFPKDCVLAKAYNGTGNVARSYDKSIGSKHDLFVRQTSELKQEIYSAYYAENSSQKWLFFPEEPFLDENQWFQGDDFAFVGIAAFAYDATVLLGLSACNAVSGSSLHLNGTDFYETIKETNFTGVTGNVILDQQTGSRVGDSVEYVVRNWLATESEDHKDSVIFRSSEVYQYAPGGDSWIRLGDYYTNGGKTFEQLNEGADLSPVKLEYKTVGLWLIVISALCCFAILSSSIGCAIWTWRHRDSRVVRASQPFFLLLLCVGTGIMGLSIIPASLEHLNLSKDLQIGMCNSYFVLLIVGTGITMSTLLAKTYRINRIMASAKAFRRIKLSVAETIYPVAIILAINIIVLSFMIRFGRIDYDLLVTKTDKFDRPIEKYPTCVRQDATKPYWWTLLAVNLIVILLALYQAWRARHLSTEFAESKYIANALLISAIVLVLSIPVLSLVEKTPNADTFLHVFMVTIATGCLTGFIFVPKMIMHNDLKNKQPSLAQKAGLRASTKDGEKIVTTKTQLQLAAEIKTLERELANMKKENTALQQLVEKLSSETSQRASSNDETVRSDFAKDMEMSDSESSDDEVDETPGERRGSIINMFKTFRASTVQFNDMNA